MPTLPVLDTTGNVAALAEVDDDDYNWASKFDWVLTPHGYVRIRTVYLHRLVKGVMKTQQWVDHIDRNPLNNKKNNLRLATVAQNSLNKRIQSNNKCGVKNVHWDKTSKKWKIGVTRHGVVYYGGVYTDLAKAGEAAVRLHKIVDAGKIDTVARLACKREELTRMILDGG